jgi:hypothetical protein
MVSRSVCVVLKVRSLDEVVVVDAVGGASVDAASEVDVGRLRGEVFDVVKEGRRVWTFPIILKISADLVGRAWTSSRVIGGNSPSMADWNEMYTRSR